MLQKIQARNQLKRIKELPWTPAEAPSFEIAWLQLAEAFIEGSKFDLAQEVLRACLQHNRVRCKRWLNACF